MSEVDQFIAPTAAENLEHLGALHFKALALCFIHSATGCTALIHQGGMGKG
jgi:hypothetical protein